MPLGVVESDRKLLIAGGALLLLLLGASVVFAPPTNTLPSPIPSTYSSQSDGAEAAYTLLVRLHYPVRRWEDPPTELPGDADAANVLLILADPTETPSAKERVAIFDFVELGGHVLFTGRNIRQFFPAADISEATPDPTWTSYSPNLPSGAAHDAARISIQPEAYWGNLTEEQLAIYGAPESTAVVSWTQGDGSVTWWAGPTPLTNAGISRDDNLTIFLNTVSNWSKDSHYHIYWDEYFHGQRSSLWSYARSTALVWGLLQISLLAGAVLLTFSRRSGPVYAPSVRSRLSPLEYVDTLGGLYQRAGAASAAVSVSYLRLRYLLARQLGLPNDLPDAELARSAEERLGWKNFASENILGRASGASRDLNLRNREALELVRGLERYTAKLEAHSQFRQEKT